MDDLTMDDLTKALSTPAGEAFACYIDGGQLSDNPYPRNTGPYEEWMLAFARELEKELRKIRG